MQPIPFFSISFVLTSNWSPISWPWLSLSYIPVGRRGHLSQNLLALSYFFSPFATSTCHSNLTHKQHSWQQLSFRIYLSATDLVSKFSRGNHSCSSSFSWGASMYLHYSWSWIWVRKKTNPRTPVGVSLQRGWPSVGLQEEISPESIMAVKFGKAQTRSRQRCGDRLGMRRLTKPCAYSAQRGKS